MKTYHWKWICMYLHALEMSLFVWPSGAPFFNCRAPFFRVAVSVGGSGPPFFRSKSLHSLDVTLSGPPRSSKDPLKNGGPQPFYLIQRGIVLPNIKPKPLISRQSLPIISLSNPHGEIGKELLNQMIILMLQSSSKTFHVIFENPWKFPYISWPSSLKFSFLLVDRSGLRWVGEGALWFAAWLTEWYLSENRKTRQKTSSIYLLQNGAPDS